MIVGRDQCQAVLLGQPAADGFAVFGIAVVEDHLAAVAARGLDLDRRRVLGHHDHRAHAQQPRRQRDRLRMIARREGDDTGLALLGCELRQRVVRAAELEGAHALEVLALEEQLGAGQRIRRGRREDGRPVDLALQAGVGGDDIVVGDGQRGHGVVASGR